MIATKHQILHLLWMFANSSTDCGCFWIYVIQNVINSNFDILTLYVFITNIFESVKIAKWSYKEFYNFVVVEVSQQLFGMKT